MSNDSGALLELVELQDESKPHQEKKNNEDENKDISLEPIEETKSNYSLSTTRSRVIVVAALLILMTAIIFGLLFGFLGNQSFERPGSKVPSSIQCNTSTEWACLDGITCIDTGLRCDGFQDCPMNGEDEQGCSSTCRDYQFDCGNGVCIANHFHCFAGENCPNGEDEMNCTHTGSCLPGYFGCTEGTCIPEHQRCNYFIDCPDRSDELPELCGRCNAENEYECYLGNCIPLYWQCDAYPDCVDGEDELHCAYTHGSDYVTLKETQMFTIHSPNYPLNYPPEAYEVYYIIAPVRYRAVVTFNHFVIDWKGFLSLGSGNDVNDHGSIFAVFGHHDNPTTVYVPSLQFFIEFHGGPYGRSRGFEASIHVIESAL